MLRAMRGLKRRAENNDHARNLRPHKARRTHFNPSAQVLSTERSIDSDNPMSYGERWHDHLRYLENFDPFRFTSPAEKILQVSNISNRANYKGIGVTVDNCLALRRIYDMLYKSNFLNGEKGLAGFKQLNTTVSQFLRWAVSNSACSKEDVWKERTLFRIVAHRDVVDSFIGFFLFRGSSGTVKAKAADLGKVCDVGIVIERNEICRSRLRFMSIMLRNTAKASRRAYRRVCRERKASHNRPAPKILNRVGNVNFFRMGAIKALDIVMGDFWRCEKEHGISKARSVVCFDLEEWFTSFVALLLLISGGQRPQVIANIQLPTVSELRQFDEALKRGTYIELQVLNEKRPRHLDLPCLILPSLIVPYLKFHINVIHRSIRERSVVTDSGKSNPLFLHVLTGNPIKTPQVTAALQKFLSNLDASFRCVTAMDLRREYATLMLDCFRRKLIFPFTTEDDFLKKIAQQMNTSPEQLKRTYMAQVDHHAETKVFVKFWSEFLTH